jgi:hypothetical protein
MMSSMKKIDRPSAVDGPVGSEGGRSPSTLSTGQASPALTATPAAAQPPRLGPLAPGQRWSVARKREVVLRRLRVYPDAKGHHIAELREFRANLGPSQGKTRLTGRELDAALADPGWGS